MKEEGVADPVRWTLEQLKTTAGPHLAIVLPLSPGERGGRTRLTPLIHVGAQVIYR